ncbi:S-layer homology domain-containing protein [Selenomonas ruminantium]|uniref:S-layer homology domain-containing protein n=1 Tax=Selenomonas ruminantium TaxID=971 RepID=A0A1M6TB94_SELRU|nr:S-layer homology domain-containing protein [Selenomonas ruminantium]SHK54028.1 S-layer homology domain-containing protein [Selenomonas ruminantium]
MKKSALMAAVLAATTLGSTAYAAQNPFKDLPEGHWAYDAVTMLAKDGVLEGYGDGTFQGTKTMNRYEMAELVSKALAKYDTARPADKGAMKKLEKEFAAELKDMDVRLKNVESDVQELKKWSGFKWYGDARLRYITNKDGSMTKPATNGQRDRKSAAEKRVRLGIYAEPAKNLSVDGRIKYEDKSFVHDGAGGKNDNAWNGHGTNNQDHFRLDKFSLNWNHAGTKLSVGRTELSMGQGLIYWENPVDGFYVSHQFGPKLNAMVGYGDIAAEGWQAENMPSFFANVAYQVSPKVSATYSTLHTNTQLNNWVQLKDASWVQRNYKLNQHAIGFNAQLTSKWNLIAEGVRNNTGVVENGKNGFWTRLTYGNMIWSKANTWKIYGEYFAFGKVAVDSTYWAHHMNIAGGNGYGRDGARGWGIAGDYMLAANTNLELCYYKLRPYDKNTAGFSKYDDIFLGALSYSF